MNRFAPVATDLFAELGEKFLSPLPPFVVGHFLSQVQVGLDLGDEAAGCGSRGCSVDVGGAVREGDDLQILQVVGVVDLVLGWLGLLLLAGKALGCVLWVGCPRPECRW